MQKFSETKQETKIYLHKKTKSKNKYRIKGKTLTLPVLEKR